MVKIKKNIKTFAVEGEAADSGTISRLRSDIEYKITEDMRILGYVPVLDLTPKLFWVFDPEKGIFNYELIMYGTHVGKRKSQDILGVLDLRPIYFEKD